MYAGEEDVDRIFKDLAVKDLEKLIRRFSSLNKKDEVSNSCRVKPYSGNHPLPEVSDFFFELCFSFLTALFLFFVYLSLNFSLQNHQVLTYLPPLPEGEDVEERAIFHDDPPESAHIESEVAASNISAASSDKGSDSEPSASGRSTSPPPAVSPRNKRKRGDFEDSGTSKPTGSPAEEQEEEEEAFHPYEDIGSVSS
jgi:hypothetical protein